MPNLIDWVTGCPGIWLSVVLGVSGRVFLDELDFGIGRLSRADGLSIVDGPHSVHWRPELNRKAEEGRIRALCLTGFEPGHPSSVPLALSLDLNCIISCSSLACQLQVLGLLSLCNCMSQFLIINLSVCLYIYICICILYLFLKFLVVYSCFTMLCHFLLHSKANLLYVCIHPFLFGFLSHLGHHRALTRVPCAVQQLPISYILYTWECKYVTPSVPVHLTPTPFSHWCPCLFSPSVRLPYLYVFGWSVSLAIPNTQGVCGVPHAGPLSGCHADLFSIPEHTYLFLFHSLCWDWSFLFPISVMWILQIQFRACVLH